MKPSALFSRPFLDLVRGEMRCVARPRDLAWLALGLAAGWWLYVPVHELLHALACLAAGGEVTRLEIDPLYGGLNSDRFNIGKRVFITTTVSISPGLTASYYITTAVGHNVDLPLRTMSNLVFAYNALPDLRRTGLF